MKTETTVETLTETPVAPVVETAEPVMAKRAYTKRGTTVPGKRVVLLDGKPVGRGRPSKNGKGKRTVVYIPAGEVYDVAKHGTGTEFRTSRHAVLRRLKVGNGAVESKASRKAKVKAVVESVTV